MASKRLTIFEENNKKMENTSEEFTQITSWIEDVETINTGGGYERHKD